MKKTKGPRQGTRKKMKKGPREKTTVNQFLKSFEEGDSVVIDVEPSSHRALPDRRFLGSTGIIAGERGDAYLVKVKDGDKEKTVITTPEHLKPLE